jgi:cyclophilin family peptidyl-prolyl cis-trans isomerase
MKNRPIIFSLVILSLFFGLSNQTLFAQKKTKSTKKDYLVTLKTKHGDMFLILYENTPKHRENFLKLAEEGFYDSTFFHRVINNFMIQGGDPNTLPGGNPNQAGQGGPGYTLEAEIRPENKHLKGALAAARQGDRVNPEKRSSGSQFYIVQNEKGCRHLNGAYTVYGQVIQGLDVIDKIATQDVNRRRGNRPLENIYITVEVKQLRKKKITKQYGYEYP